MTIKKKKKLSNYDDIIYEIQYNDEINKYDVQEIDKDVAGD